MSSSKVSFFPCWSEEERHMNLCRVSVEGFRNVKSTEINLDKMVALVSLNSYGKSNVLKAIDFGIDFIKSNEDMKKKMMAWSKGIPLNKDTAWTDFGIELEMVTLINNETWRIIYSYKFKWIRNDESGARIVAESLKAKLEGKKQKYNVLINRVNDDALYRSTETGRCSNKINIDSHNLVINKLEAFDNLYYSEIVKKINKLNVYIERHLDAANAYEPDPIIRKGADVLAIESIDNLPRTIFHLKQQYPEKFNLLTNAYMQLFPQINEIEVEELSVKSLVLKEKLPAALPFTISNEVYMLYVTDQNLNQPISFEDMSDGAKRVFLLLTNIIVADINNLTLIAVEEPENSIHPSLLQSYLRILSQFLGDCKIIITSHSPYIIQYLEPSDVYVGLPNTRGVAQFKRIRLAAQKMLLNDATSADMSTGDYIFELLSGTEEDIKAIERYLETDK